MSDVSFTPSGPPEAILPDPDPDLVAGLAGDVAGTARRHPADPLVWATLGDQARAEGADDLVVYAFYRVGYHRGLDLLRKSGWKGSGYVRSTHPANRGFLRCLAALAETAAAIGEDDEAERCRQFLQQLDPR